MGNVDSRDHDHSPGELAELRERITEYEQRFCAFSQACSEAMVIHEGARIVDVNPTCTSMFGYRSDDLLGMDIGDLLSSRARASLEQGTEPAEVQEILCQRRDGSSFLARVRGVDTTYHGRPVRVTVFRDVSEEVHAEQRFRKFFDRVPVYCYMVAPDGTILDANTAALTALGYEKHEIVGRPLRVLYAQDALPRARELFEKWRREGRLDGEEVTILTKAGDRRAVILSAEAIRDESGEIAHSVSVQVDVTEKKASEEERRRLDRKVQQAQKLESLGVLAGGIAHDFNNLLMGIMGNTELALLKLKPTSPALPLIEKISTAAHRAAELTNQMLAYSGKGQFLIQPIDLSELVEEMTHLLETVVSKRAALRFDFAAELPAVEVDAAQIRQVVMNLLSNASDALGDKNGVITVSTGVIEVDRAYLTEVAMDGEIGEGRYVFVEVSDTGCGMDEATLHRIFDPFFTTKSSGRGLGLAATVGIVRGHRGAIKVYSEEGKGTAIKILLPASDSRGEIRPVPERDADGWRGHGLALVVDDDEMVRDAAGAILEEFGFTTVTACDGQEAVELFQERADEVRVVLLDMTMPRMDGIETFLALRRIRPDVKVVLSSGYNEHDATSHLSGKGLAGFVQKPYSPRTLMRIVRGILES